MKRLFLFAAVVVALLILSWVTYNGFWESANTSSSPVTLSSSHAQAQGRLLARLRFDPPVFGGCSVHDAWLEKSSTYVARGWYRIRLGNETVQTTAIRVVMDMPEDRTLPPTHLSFEESNPAAYRLGLTGSATQPLNTYGARYQMFESNTVFPPPAIMKFSCDYAMWNATVVNESP